MKATRRQALQGLMILPVLVAAGRANGAPRPTASQVPTRDETRPSPTGLAGITPGTPVGPCTLVAIGTVDRGALPVTLEAPDGDTFRVDVLRHDEATPGVARAGALGLYLANGGTGTKRTNEEHGLGAMALARLLARHRPSESDATKLLTLRQRAALLTPASG